VTDHQDAVIVGAGQAGLAMSHCLCEAGMSHVILERGQIAQRWRQERWDGFHLQFPRSSLCLPGFPLSAQQSSGFADRDEIVEYLETYARHGHAPVATSTEVLSLHAHRSKSAWVLRTTSGEIETSNVIIASGPFQRPAIPNMHAVISHEIEQCHSSIYRNPAELPNGAVLVVGSGGSGAQIAEELRRAGREVFLSIGRHRRIPRTYRGRDAYDWLLDMGNFDVTVDSLRGNRTPPGFLFSGVDGGRSIDLRRFINDGVTLLGRMQAVDGNSLSFADDVQATLCSADQAALSFKDNVDDYVHRLNMACDSELEAESDDFAMTAVKQGPRRINIRAAGIKTVIWCTGYRFDLGWVHAPVLDSTGAPVQRRGVTACPGIYFLGLYFMHKFKSATTFGVGEDASYLAGHILAQR
jgi:putative flavoprotein involved in K+ transport